MQWVLCWTSAKGILPIAVLALWNRRSLGLAAVFSIAWCSLVTFSWLATHATVSTAIATIERSGTWKMEVRSSTKAELASLEQQLATLSRPSPPRPAKAVREALAAERVPASIWQDSQECKSIQESAHFAKACAQVVQLRRELAAAQEYERLSARTRELRGRLAKSPIVATSDPLPCSLGATLGRLLPLEGAEGVALLLTIFVELMSCFGLAGLSALYRGRDERDPGITGAHSLAATVPIPWNQREAHHQQRANHPPCGPSLIPWNPREVHHQQCANHPPCGPSLNPPQGLSLRGGRALGSSGSHRQHTLAPG